MKKYIVILATLLLLSADTLPASSFYRPYLASDTGMAVYNDTWRSFSVTSFDTQMNGIYTLNGTYFYTSYSGIAQITGNCRQDKVSDIGLRMVIEGYSAPVLIARTEDEVFTFSFPFFAGDFQLQGFNYDAGRYDLLKCDILIEAVE